MQRCEGLDAELLVARAETSGIAARLLAELPIADVTIEDPPIEEVIGQVFSGAVPAAAEAEPASA